MRTNTSTSPSTKMSTKTSTARKAPGGSGGGARRAPAGDRRGSRLATLCIVGLGVLACGDSGVAPGTPDGSPASVVRSAAPAHGANSVTAGSAQRGATAAVLQAFHGALNASDYEAIRAIWTDDATLTVGAVQATGPTEIADFFATSGPFVNGWAALAPTYKTQVEVDGRRATYAFECVYVPDTGVLAGQTVVAHLNASGTLRKVGDRWLFESFTGGAGPLP